MFYGFVYVENKDSGIADMEFVGCDTFLDTVISEIEEFLFTTTGKTFEEEFDEGNIFIAKGEGINLVKTVQFIQE